MFLVILVTALLIGFLTPVAKIDPATCSRILPGMTKQQAEQVVGAPFGWYDGVRGIITNAPARKGEPQSWIGLRGEMVVDLDQSGRVTKAAFYDGNSSSWALWVIRDSERFSKTAESSWRLTSDWAGFSESAGCSDLDGADGSPD